MSNKKKILVIQPIHKAGIDLLEDHPKFDFEVIENLDASNINSKISECDALSIRTAKLSAALIEEAKNLNLKKQGKPIKPTINEIKSNPRSRSAIMRIAIKNV